ncbi:hypothetical protein CLU79DRAFT_776605 [Phycomyces nitens]|nr:hypothetical protein CLU79DRAFT_776605 [Phycomyces nitens]
MLKQALDTELCVCTTINLSTIILDHKCDLWIFFLRLTIAIYGCKTLNSSPIFSLLFGSNKLSWKKS